MKLEINLDDEEQLRSVHRELKAKIEIVEFALARFANIAPRDQGAVGRIRRRTENLLEPTVSQRVRDAIDAAGPRFTSRQIYEQFDPGQRPSVKSVFRDRIKKNLIKVLRHSGGPNPAVYEKIHTA
jgi:hypothetical protein